jgi:hypothetical protein
MFTGAVVAATAGAGATPAVAQTSNWTITPGGPITIYNITHLLMTVDTTHFGAYSWYCNAGTVNATGSVVNTATGATPQLGTIINAAFGTSNQPCSFFFGLGVVATLDDPIGFHATGNPSGGVTPGRLGPNINLTFKGVGGFACNMHVTGSSVPGSYDNGTGILTVNPTVSRTLHFDAVTGCSIGGIPWGEVGDAFGFQADFTVFPNQTISHS